LYKTYAAVLSHRLQAYTRVISREPKGFKLTKGNFEQGFLVDTALLCETDDAFKILRVQRRSSCTTQLKESLPSLLLAFALSGWLTA